MSFRWGYLHDNADTILAALREHALMTTQTVSMAVLVALPLAFVAYWFRPLTRPIRTLIVGGFRDDVQADIMTGTALCVALALALDLALVGVGRLLTPWTRGAH